MSGYTAKHHVNFDNKLYEPGASVPLGDNAKAIDELLACGAIEPSAAPEPPKKAPAPKAKGKTSPAKPAPPEQQEPA